LFEIKFNQMDSIVRLTAEELEFIRKGTSEYNKIKMSLGDLEMQKHSLLKEASKIVESFNKNEQVLIQKYGADVVINMQTGEVKQK
jgi:hypothetical protein